MSSLLTTLRQKTRQLTPMEFLTEHPGAWIQYYDDTPAKNPAKAVSAPFFVPSFARKKQRDRCSVCFSLQSFSGKRIKEAIESFRNLGVDIDLVPKAEQCSLSPQEIDRRKDEYLRRCLLPFPLKPHWLIETRHGFHVLFRIRSVRDPVGIRLAQETNRRLVALLGGDDRACLLTQVLRVPGTYQWKDPLHPFLCRLLLDNGRVFAPYELHVIRGVLDALEVFDGGEKAVEQQQSTPDAGDGKEGSKWRERLRGVPEGQRNATAASVIGGILCRLPEEFWEVAGWGGLKEWNGRNPVPLPQRELRSVFESIARRERGKKASTRRGTRGQGDDGPKVSIAIRIEGTQTLRSLTVENLGNQPRSASGFHVPPSSHVEH